MKNNTIKIAGEKHLAKTLEAGVEEAAGKIVRNPRFKRKSATEKRQSRVEYRENKSEKKAYNRSHKSQLKRAALKLERKRKANPSLKPQIKKGYTRVN